MILNQGTPYPTGFIRIMESGPQSLEMESVQGQGVIPLLIGMNTVMNQFVPIYENKDKYFRSDNLIRIAMCFLERMNQNGGWPRWWEWDIYPPRDIFTAHTRSFPALIFLWGHLSLSFEENRWVHTESDADAIYDQLQRLYQFYIESDSRDFADIMYPRNVPYIAYSAARKEKIGSSNKVKGVLNTHAHALQFAWLMREASEIKQDAEMEGVCHKLVAIKYQAAFCRHGLRSFR